jgi:peptidoglycan/xylan/chitin deacetylase (PgdA/CDA1 family)
MFWATRKLFLQCVPLRVFLQKEITLPFYHVVSDCELPHIKHLYRYRDVKTFNNDLEFLLKHFEAVDLQTLMEVVSNGNQVIKPSFHLTFDDGFSECYEIIMPILWAKGVPATFLLCTDFLDNKDMFFKNKISVLLENRDIGELEIKEIKNFLSSKNIVVKVKDDSNVLSLFEWKNIHIVDDVCALFGVDIPGYLEKEKPYLTSEQVGKMLANGFTIGSHSLNHPLFSEITLEEQCRQVFESFEFLKKQFFLDYFVFAFPHSDINVRYSFYEATDSYVELYLGTDRMKADCVKKSRQRFSMENRHLSAEEIFKQNYLLKMYEKIISRNLIKRL